MLTDGDYIVRMVDFPGDVNSTLRLSDNDYGNIYINDWLSPMARRRAFKHEYDHLEGADMDSERSIYQVEGR